MTSRIAKLADRVSHLGHHRPLLVAVVATLALWILGLLLFVGFAQSLGCLHCAAS